VQVRLKDEIATIDDNSQEPVEAVLVIELGIRVESEHRHGQDNQVISVASPDSPAVWLYIRV